MKTRIYFRDNAVMIEGNPIPFVAGTLWASLEGETIRIRRYDDGFAHASPAWDAVANRDGETFPTPEAALAYLGAELAKRRIIGTTIVEMTAAADLGGHRVVGGRIAGMVGYVSADEADDAGLAVGITLGAAAAGTPVLVVTGGEMIEASWSWRVGPVYLGLDGALTQDPALAGFDQQIASATGLTRIIVGIQAPVILAN